MQQLMALVGVEILYNAGAPSIKRLIDKERSIPVRGLQKSRASKPGVRPADDASRAHRLKHR
jgi:hypothetical protein